MFNYFTFTDHSHELFKNENGHESKTEPSMIRKTHNDLSKNSREYMNCLLNSILK